MITQIEYERLRQEVDDLKRELASYETLSRVNAKAIRELHAERNELKKLISLAAKIQTSGDEQ
jgi:chromosome segregation ATPase